MNLQASRSPKLDYQCNQQIHCGRTPTLAGSVPIGGGYGNADSQTLMLVSSVQTAISLRMGPQPWQEVCPLVVDIATQEPQLLTPVSSVQTAIWL